MNDLPFVLDVFKMWNNSATSIIAVPGLDYTFLHQHILPTFTSKSEELGGNSLGLTPSQEPLIMTLLSLTWENASDDAIVMTAAQLLMDEIEAAAKAKGVYNLFKYLNYADGGQDVIEGYGPENKAHLQATSRAYDPQGLFQKAVPGGFKLFSHAPPARD